MVKDVWVICRIFRKNALESPKSSFLMDSSNTQMLSGSRNDGVVDQLGSKLENYDSFHGKLEIQTYISSFTSGPLRS
jgi:hypothetical protein